jgi:hypothetical protein
MNSSLAEAIENLYSGFGDVCRPTGIVGCPCCWNETEGSILLAKPLRALTCGDLAHYARSVFLTVSGDDFFYFLPRILEAAASDSEWLVDIEITGRGIKDSGYAGWPAGRRVVVLAFFEAILDEIMNDSERLYELDSWLCAPGLFLDDLSPILDRVAQNPRALISFYEDNSTSLMRGELSNAFWSDAAAMHAQVVAWFNSKNIRDSINVAYGLA